MGQIYTKISVKAINGALFCIISCCFACLKPAGGNKEIFRIVFPEINLFPEFYGKLSVRIAQQVLYLLIVNLVTASLL